MQIEPPLSAEELAAAEAFYTKLQDELIVARSAGWLERRDRDPALHGDAHNLRVPNLIMVGQGMQTWVKYRASGWETRAGMAVQRY